MDGNKAAFSFSAIPVWNMWNKVNLQGYSDICRIVMRPGVDVRAWAPGMSSLDSPGTRNCYSLIIFCLLIYLLKYTSTTNKLVIFQQNCTDFERNTREFILKILRKIPFSYLCGISRHIVTCHGLFSPFLEKHFMDRNKLYDCPM